MRHGQFDLINEVLINWYQKRINASLFSEDSMLK